ncbi:MAG: hypothetical protein HBSIN02_10200 [Bacteroidia bacterium]|nr:MAG: hypothetical protein HBSIN02_10200 [Bacteroidia bacterium]
MISSLILILQVLCLSLWIGGSAVLWLLVAPQIFMQVPREMAGALTGTIFRRFSSAMLGVLVILAATILVQLAGASESAGLKLRFALILVFGGMLLNVYDRYILSPRMHSANTDGSRRIHRQSVVLFVLNLFLGIAVVITFIVPIAF